MAIHKIIISGFGGQGVMSMGMMLAYAGMMEGKEVTWMPAYGPEMRGGTANCSIIISDKPISSPVVTKATAVVVMNLPSLAKFEGSLIENGTLFVNTSLVNKNTSRNDVEVCGIPANELAIELQNDKTSNMVMLGAIVEKTNAVRMETVNEVLGKIFSGSKAKLIPVNTAALEAGKKEILKQFV